MIGPVVRILSPTILKYSAVGPVPVGFVIRGLWVSVTCVVRTEVHLAPALSEVGEESLEGLSAGSPLLGKSEIAPNPGWPPGFNVAGLAYSCVVVDVPVYVPVLNGPVWVLFGVGVGAGGYVMMGLDVEVERTVQLSREGRGTRAARYGGGGVMAELRAAAESARNG